MVHICLQAPVTLMPPSWSRDLSRWKKKAQSISRNDHLGRNYYFCLAWWSTTPCLKTPPIPVNGDLVKIVDLHHMRVSSSKKCILAFVNTAQFQKKTLKFSTMHERCQLKTEFLGRAR